MNEYKWVFVENKAEIIKEIIGNIIDGENVKKEIRIIHLDDYQIDDIDSFEIDELRKLVINENVKIFSKVIDNEQKL